MANDGGGSIQQTNDGGYIVAGTSYSNDGDVSGNHGEADAWVVKLSSIGAIEWQKSLGGSGYDGSNFIQQTNDGGYILAAKSLSNDWDVSGNHGSGDCWVVKLSNIGAIEWQKSLGGSGSDGGHSIQQTNDGGYIVAGTSNSNDGDVSGNHGGLDYWVVKLTSVGAIEWQKSLGGSASEQSFSIELTNDGGYILSGFSESNDGDVSGNHGYIDYWVVKLSNIGTIEWQKSLGGSSAEMAFSIQQTNDGGYVVAGYSMSNDGDVSNTIGFVDSWVVKLTSIGAIEWQKSLGGLSVETANAIQQTNDGGYIVGGYSTSNDGDVSGNHGDHDYWVVKLSGCQQSSSQSNISSCGPYVSEAGQLYNESTSFNYVLSNATGCDSVVNVNITILPLPSTNISPSNALLTAGDSIQLSANGALTYSWTPDNGLSCNDCPSPFASPNEPTTYIVAGTAENGCISYDSIEVDIRCNEPFIPTIFSPNGKGPASNELLCLFSNCVAQIKFVIFNRWGEQVFETEVISKCWDGFYKGEEASSGLYAYNLFIQQLDGTVVNKKGMITLLK
jgi:gliding motility-associated-like protein